MSTSSELTNARTNKNDEFYTRRKEIEEECKYYKDYFRGKVVYCNCDDPRQSNFTLYFMDNFKQLGLKKLISTGYKEHGNGVVSVYEGVGGAAAVTELKGSGDFRSDECLEFLKEADVVVTNPPFSKFRVFVRLLEEYKKDYLLIGNMNATTAREIFPLFKENKMWYGVSITCGDRPFYVPDDYDLFAAGCGVDEEGKRYVKVKGVRWFTNIDHDRRNKSLALTKSYEENPGNYPRYENYDAIEVGKTGDIPMDYKGIMGVPITFLDKYCPGQFEILGITATWDNSVEVNAIRTDKRNRNRGIVDGKTMYARILIKRI